jgi:hypothetical protein
MRDDCDFPLLILRCAFTRDRGGGSDAGEVVAAKGQPTPSDQQRDIRPLLFSFFWPVYRATRTGVTLC